MRHVLCLLWAFVLASILAGGASARAQDLVVDGMATDPAMRSITLGGVRRYATVRVIRGGRIVVPPFNGTDRVNTGNLVLIANSIVVDATSSITARGAGYQTVQCGNGAGPNPLAGGRGGCAVFDSGGGGAHFGRGGRGTKDGPTSFPAGFEEDCGNSLSGAMCSTTSNCRNNDGLPTVGGSAYFHSVYDIEFGAAGGDKGCRDGDGFSSQPMVGGPGGGRIVLVALTADARGSIQIDGTVTASGRRGCGTGNDSGGGGAGGSVFVVGDTVSVGTTGIVSAAGGRGGDTFAGAVGQPDQADCPAMSQTGGLCDDCGGGGGGGIVSIESRTANFADGATFDVGGANGGVCPICTGEAGGGAGELQLDGLYVGEVCDGYDNDFDGSVDEALGTITCGLGPCATSLPACTGGRPTACAPAVTSDACCAPRDSARPRVSVILDTSASMLLDLAGYPTFGDGSAERPGIDTSGDGQANDSRLYLAREALGNVISAYPEIDFALARYHQDMGEGRFCQNAAWFECAGIVGTYDDPTNNTGALACNVRVSPTRTIPVARSSPGDECINYAGSCGGPRQGADVLAGFGSRNRDLVRWLDGRETRFIDDETRGDVCDHASGGDCELRGSGPTPLAGALQAISDYAVPIRTSDCQRSCRTYSVILVTDGAESCSGDPVAAARELFEMHGMTVYVIAVSVRADEEASLNAIANAGSGGRLRTATFVRRPEDLVPALTSIISDSLRTERCNGMDDNCNFDVDEGFPNLGTTCDDGRRGVCRGTGRYVCAGDGLGTECRIEMPGATPGTEVCNGMDDDCDDGIDEGLTCTGGCTPTGPEVCNGLDDNCNGLVDEADPAIGRACGEEMGLCEPGSLRCVLGMLRCVGGVAPRDEICNGLDDNCDGVGDNLARCPGETACVEGACRRPCDPTREFTCPPGFECAPHEGGTFCVPTPCAACTDEEICRDGACVNLCTGIVCEDGARCIRGECFDCTRTGCPSGQLCSARRCVTDRCASVTCPSPAACVDGTCETLCDPSTCAASERCGASGCEADPCDGVSCGTGLVCVEGACRSNPCLTMTCPLGDVCVPAVGCIADPCATVRCGSGRRCVPGPTGAPTCEPTGPMLDAGGGDAGPTRVLAAGGRCSTTYGGSSPSWIALLVGLAAMVRARRSR